MWSALTGRKKERERPPASRPSKLGAASRHFGPPLSAEESGANLTVLERDLNARMVCPAGKNQVFIRSLVVVGGTTPPRIALKCHLRRDIGLSAEVYYEHIRDVCCRDPGQCQAYNEFKDRFVQT